MLDNILIYGPEEPHINFRQLPTRGKGRFNVENDYVLERHEGDPNELGRTTWRKLAVYGAREKKQFEIYNKASHETEYAPLYQLRGENYRTLPERELPERISPENLFWTLIHHLKEEICDSQTEADFLQMYARLCVENARSKEKSALNDEPFHIHLWESPALIPQVWINWLHYDPKSKSRAIRAKNQPFRVDFVLIDETSFDRMLVIEVDGKSHFCYYDEGKPKPSMKKYTKHVRRDRWLRRKGYKVVRITNQEVYSVSEESDELYSDFEHLLRGTLSISTRSLFSQA